MVIIPKGCHPDLNSSRWKLPEPIQQQRNRVFWSLFANDTWMVRLMYPRFSLYLTPECNCRASPTAARQTSHLYTSTVLSQRTPKSMSIPKGKGKLDVRICLVPSFLSSLRCSFHLQSIHGYGNTLPSCTLSWKAPLAVLSPPTPKSSSLTGRLEISPSRCICECAARTIRGRMSWFRSIWFFPIRR